MTKSGWTKNKTIDGVEWWLDGTVWVRKGVVFWSIGKRGTIRPICHRESFVDAKVAAAEIVAGKTPDWF